MMVVVPDPGREQEERRQEDMIIAAELSTSRVDKFRIDYLTDRQQSATAEMLFDKAGVYQKDAAWNDGAAFGFNVLLHKGPFVDNSSWAEYRTWPFAVAIQRRLFNDVEQDLLAGAAAVRTHGSGLEATLSAVDDLVERVDGLGYNPSLIILAGAWGSDLTVELWKHPLVTPDWDLDLPSKLWILGSYRGILVANLAELSHSGVYVADLNRLGTLTRHDELQFDVTPIDTDKARSFLREQKQASGNESDIRSMLLQVHVRLYESFSVELKEQGAALYSALE